MTQLQKLTRGILVALLIVLTTPARADEALAKEVLDTWLRLSLELVRHTPTYTPPVASRAFGYIGVTAYEAVVVGSDDLQSLAGQLNGLTALPGPTEGGSYDQAIVLQSALAPVISELFANTGPTGQRALSSVTARLHEKVTADQPAEVVAVSEALGAAIGAHVLAWAATDGGAVIDNLGFPMDYSPVEGPSHWVPTSLVRLQQSPLLPQWGQNRPFAMPAGTTCTLPPPPEYSEDPGSVFYQQALEVMEVKANLTPEQTAIARFWADDAMLSMTPPGHWIAIARQIFDRDDAPLSLRVDVLARLGVAMADAFIGCWQAKFEHDLLRPITFIRRVHDPKWEPLLLTPPFPEYPSGHSVQSGAAATVLTAHFGEDFAFDDASRENDGLAMRSFPSFWAAAEEAGISRLYGGIHFRAAIDNGLEQGRCIGAFAANLITRG